MVRKQVYITQEQDEALKRLAQQLDVTEAEIIRRSLEGISAGEVSYVAGQASGTRYIREVAMQDRYRADIQGLDRAHRLDEQAWQEELALIKQRAQAVAGSTVKFRREDSYDKRRLRLPD